MVIGVAVVKSSLGLEHTRNFGVELGEIVAVNWLGFGVGKPSVPSMIGLFEGFSCISIYGSIYIPSFSP